MFSSSGGQSVFSSNVGSRGGGGSAFSSSSSGGRDTETVKKFKKLSKYSKSLKPLFTAYQEGRYNQLNNLLSQANYQNYSVQIRRLKEGKRRYKEYEDLRELTTNSLQGMYRAYQQFGDNKDLQQQLRNIQDAEEILYNPQLLHEYLETLQPVTYALPTANVTAIAATLRPEYAEYISLHGYPEDGIFDMDLLADILNNQAATVIL